MTGHGKDITWSPLLREGPVCPSVLSGDIFNRGEPEDMAMLTEIKDSMLRHWDDGLRGDKFHDAVRSDCPTATLSAYQEAAEAAWAERCDQNTKDTEMRSVPGKGEPVWIYVLGLANEHADGIVPSYGVITAGCGPNLREDFSETRWPVVVKVKQDVLRDILIQHLRDLADAIEGGAL